MTATETLAPGYVTLWPSGAPLPLVASLNATTAAQTIPNAAIVTLNSEAIDVFTPSGAHLVLDLFGYYLPQLTTAVSWPGVRSPSSVGSSEAQVRA